MPEKAGESFGGALPISYFYTNPNTFVGDVVGNHAFSRYNALQLDVRKAWRAGLTAQFNYTWSRVTTDFAGTAANFRALFDNAQPELEIMRPWFDITHTLNALWVVGDTRRRKGGAGWTGADALSAVVGRMEPERGSSGSIPARRSTSSPDGRHHQPRRHPGDDQTRCI